MIYNASGRSVRRTIGFVREIVTEQEKAGEINVTAFGFEVPCTDYEPFISDEKRSKENKETTHHGRKKF